MLGLILLLRYLRASIKYLLNYSRYVANLIILFIVVGGTLSCSTPTPEQKWELVQAIPTYQPNKCVQPNSHERSLFEIAASSIELISGDDSNWLDIGAQKFLAGTVYRTENTNVVAVCIPNDVLNRVSDALTSRKGFGKGRLSEYQLELASKLPNRSPYLMEAVAESAFNANIQPSEIFSFRDIRPYARTVLASFGVSANNFGQVAYQQMSIETSLGTGAAQVAAATGIPQALPRIEKMMQTALATVPKDKAIPREMRNRLYEMSWAIYYAGDAGTKYTSAIHEIMNRQVQSWAPPLGMVDLQPKRLCDVVRRIEGEKSIQAYKFCIDDKVPFDQ